MTEEKPKGSRQRVPEDSEDFGVLFEKSLKPVKPGEIVRGHVVQVTRDYVTVDIGYKTEGLIPASEFRGPDRELQLAEGDEVDVFFESNEVEDGFIRLSRNRARQLQVWQDIEEAYQNSGYVDGTIVGRVKGGLKVDVGVPAFLPGSHADVRPSRNLDRYIGQQSRFSVIKFNRSRGNVVVSRRNVIEREREALKEETLQVLEEGVILEGTVKNLTDYGAFVDLGGIDGLLHVTDMSWGRVGRPSEVVNVGDKIRVVVLKYDRERERVSLGMKQILPDPWKGIHDRILPGMRIRGHVVSLTDYGAFVEIESGIEGLVHVSEMSWTKRVNHPREVLQEGEEVNVQVLDVDPQNRRISLGLKQTIENPWELVKVNHPVGSKIRGPIKNITDFGVFVEVEEGIDGLVHVSDLHWTKKVKHPSELYQKGEEVEAVVLDIDTENQRLSLGIKQLTSDPWQTFAERYPIGSHVKGRATSIADFGVFVEIEEGIEGLVHISQLSRERIEKPQDLYRVGDEIEVEVLNVDTKDRRVALSVKALTQSEERREWHEYMREEQEKARFSFRDILKDDLPLDRDRTEDRGSSSRGNDEGEDGETP